jgi:hypothetical protein
MHARTAATTSALFAVNLAIISTSPIFEFLLQNMSAEMTTSLLI